VNPSGASEIDAGTMAEQRKWQPVSSVESLSRRAAMLRRARTYFEENDVLEVETPILSRNAVSDPHIASIEVDLQLDRSRSWFLHTSPEYFMKRLLCAGFPDIYQICKVFRDSEYGRHHEPEFTMVEWYRLGFELNAIMHDTIDFISRIVDSNCFKGPPDILNYGQAFSDIVGVDYKAVDTATRDQLLVDKLAPELPTDRLTLLYHYPADQAALARICPEDASVADRFELFAGSVELANGYVELVDADEQIDRFNRDQRDRAAAGKPQRPIDEDFIAALKSGLPACAGVAVGFDRVHMLNERADDIRQVLSFGFQPGNKHG
jgi:lysyl-tRNA synthetase class 2